MNHLLRPTLRTASLAVLTSSGLSACNYQAKCESNDEVKLDKMIALYLKPESKVMIEAALTKKGIKSPKVDYICIHSNPSTDINHVYAPLFGQRAAFRLKRIIYLENGGAVGMGRVSTMAGEIVDREFEASMPIMDSEKVITTEDSHLLLDVPTRLRHSPAFEKVIWKGRLTSTKLFDRVYKPLKAEMTTLNGSDQLVVDGYLCRSDLRDENGVCHAELAEVSSTADTPTKETEEIVPTLDQQNGNEDAETTDNAKAAEESGTEEEKDECPVCKYMKAGQCKDQFLQWDSCLRNIQDKEELSVCFQVTKAMMKCMHQYEYYDIMIAGTDPKKFDD